MKKAEITIYGKKYTVNSEYENRYIDRLTFYVNGKIKELVMRNPRLEYADACALCLLNLADDVMREKEKYATLLEEQDAFSHSKEEINEMIQRTEELEQKIQSLEEKNNELVETLTSRDNELIKVRMNLEESYNRENKVREELQALKKQSK
ncbi:MAG: cell division protein ZapA [Tissierellia bacterium]|nr:cell division protein ZapA [Tissierellia bacterium]